MQQNQSQSTKLKFRPSLTLDEIQTILTNLPLTYTELRRKLEIFTLKATHGIATPSHVVTGPKSLEDSLGFSAPKQSTGEELYKIWQSHPHSLSKLQLNSVDEYRYLNDLMNPEEESIYESRIMRGD